MKIAFFTDAFLPKYDGVVTAISFLAKELAKEGNEILIFTPRPKKRVDLKPAFGDFLKKIKVIYLPATRDFLYPDLRFASPTAIRIIPILRRFHPDIIHFHTPATTGITGVLAAKILNKPLVSTFHTYFMEPEALKVVKMEKFRPLSIFLWKFSNFLHDRSNLIICPSKYVLSDLKKQGVKAPLVYIPNGIEIIKPPKIDSNLVKKRYGFQKYNLLYVGRISKEKNLDVLIESLPEVKKEIPDFKLNLVGDGPAITELLKLAVKRKVSANINFFGPIKREELMNSGIFQASDLFVTPSTFETQCLAAVEAMMFGLPLVVAKAKGLRELVSGNGLTVWPANKKNLAEAIIKLLKNERLRKKMGQKSGKLVWKFDIKITTKKTFEEYQKLLRPKKPGLFERIFQKIPEM